MAEQNAGIRKVITHTKLTIKFANIHYKRAINKYERVNEQMEQNVTKNLTKVLELAESRIVKLEKTLMANEEVLALLEDRELTNKRVSIFEETVENKIENIDLKLPKEIKKNTRSNKKK